jgi:hypothetical protein
MEVIIDIEQNEWLKSIPKEHINEIVNKYLKLGYLTSSLMKTELNISNELFEPIQESLNQVSLKNSNKLELIGTQINENLDYVKQSIDKLTQYTNKSVTKGFYGEKCVEELISQNFPDYTINNNTHNPHSSDYEVQNYKGQKFLIEVKNYTRNVPTTEVNKFIDDLEKSDIQIGLFLSLNSGICNKKRFMIDSLENNKKIIYLPNIQQETSMIIMAILMAESLNTILLNDCKKINESNLMIIYEEFQLFYQSYNNIIQSIKDTKNNIEKNVLQLYNVMIENDLKIKNYFQNIQVRLNEELFVLNSITINTSYQDLEIIIDSIKDKNIKTIYYDLYQIIIQKQFNIKIDQLNQYYWIINEDYTIDTQKKKVFFYMFGNTITLHNSKIFDKIF